MRRALTVGLLAAVLAVSLVAFATGSGGEASMTPPAKLQCGVERWAVKTLSDKRARLVNFHPRRASVAGLRRKPRRSVGFDTPRLSGVERTTYRVRARLVEFALEDDHDIHLVIASPRHAAQTMIVEFPDVHCDGARRSIKKRPMRCRRRLNTGPPAPV